MRASSCRLCGALCWGPEVVRARVWVGEGKRRRLRRAPICRQCAGLTEAPRRREVWAIQLRLPGVA